MPEKQNPEINRCHIGIDELDVIQKRLTEFMRLAKGWPDSDDLMPPLEAAMGQLNTARFELYAQLGAIVREQTIRSR